eukprot:844978-Prorocentrum_minimum.AAC.1
MNHTGVIIGAVNKSKAIRCGATQTVQTVQTVLRPLSAECAESQIPTNLGLHTDIAPLLSHYTTTVSA